MRGIVTIPTMQGFRNHGNQYKTHEQTRRETQLPSEITPVEGGVCEK